MAGQSRATAGGPSLVDQAIAAVSDYIRANGLKVGDRLPGEAQFAERLAVSRAVMREAFGALSALKVVDVGNGRLPRVGGLDAQVFGRSLDHAIDTDQVSVPEVWDVRRTLEVRTAVLAAQHRTEAEARAILAHAEAMAAAQDRQTLMTEHDIALHLAIASASHNALFAHVVSSFRDLMRKAVPLAWETRRAVDERDLMIQRHLEVAEAILRRDPERAAAAMDRHFDTAVQTLLDAGVR